MSDDGYIKLENGSSAFLAVPAGKVERGLVILPSMPGTTPAFEAKARELADARSWAVCIPEIITEIPGASFEQRRAAVGTLDDEDVFRTLRSAATTTAAERVALIGFCVGGMYAIKATSLGVFDRLVSFYGMVHIPEYWRSPGQGEPLDYLEGNADAILAIFGERDEFIPNSEIDVIEAAGVATVRYPEAGHAFAHDPLHDHHRAADAANAWRRALDFISGGSGDGPSRAAAR